MILALVAPTLLALSGSPAYAADPLDAAWQKELAYLEAEKKAVTTRLADEKRRMADDVAAREAALATAQGRVLALGRAADAAEDAVAGAQRDADAAADGQDALGGLLQGAADTYGLTLPAEAPEDAVRAAFTAAADDLRGSTGVTKGPGAFFLPDGTQVEGTVLRLGHVAAWGVADRGAGALLPVGDGRLQVATAADAAEARAVVGGARPPSVGMFLFEGPDKRLEEEKGKSLADILEAGGSIGWVIVGLGGVLALLTVLRAIVLTRAGVGLDRLEEQALTIARTGDRGRLAAALSGRNSPLSRLLRAVVNASPAPRPHLEDVASTALDREAAGIERFGTALLVIASVAPLLGLLGTVTGMIGTFDVITEHGTGNPKLLSGGISEALVTTELGLIVAIPGVLLGNLLNARARTLVSRIEGAAMSLIHVLTGLPREPAEASRPGRPLPAGAALPSPDAASADPSAEAGEQVA